MLLVDRKTNEILHKNCLQCWKAFNPSDTVYIHHKLYEASKWYSKDIK